MKKLNAEQIRDLKNMIQYWTDKFIDRQINTKYEYMTWTIITELRDELFSDIDSKNITKGKK